MTMNVSSEKLAPLLDYAIARYLQADPLLVTSSLQKMAGKTVGISLKVPELEFFLLIKEDTIHISAHYNEPPDTWIRGNFFDLAKLGLDTGGDTSATHLEIIGDVQLGQRLQQLFSEIEFDWEELLAPIIGDIPTHQISEGVRIANDFVARCVNSLAFSSGEFLREELKITPTQQEITYFIDGVEKLRDTVERLDGKTKSHHTKIMFILKLWRLLAINLVLVRHGLDEIVLAIHLFRPIHFVFYLLPWNWLGKKKQPLAARIRLALEDLGPIFVKFGQALSTRPDLLSPELIAELEKLQDKVPPFAGDIAQAKVEQAMGAPINEVFAHFDTRPLASASIAQVHAAQLDDGSDVVVKILRPKCSKANQPRP